MCFIDEETPHENIDNGAMTLATQILSFVAAVLIVVVYTTLTYLLWLVLAKFVTKVLKRSRTTLEYVYYVLALVFMAILVWGVVELNATPYDQWQGDIPRNLWIGAIGSYPCILLAYWEQQHDLRRLLRSEDTTPS
jgi:hypothetical protein